MGLGLRARGVASVCLCCSLGASAFQGRGVHPQWAPILEDLASGYHSVSWCIALPSPQHGPSCKQSTFQMRPWAALFRNLLRPLPSCFLSLLPGCPSPPGAASGHTLRQGWDPAWGRVTHFCSLHLGFRFWKQRC